MAKVVIESPVEENVSQTNAPVKTKKSKKTEKVVEEVVQETSPVVGDVVVQEETSKTSKKKKSVKAVEPVPSVEEVENIVVPPSSDEVVSGDSVDEVSVIELFSQFNAKLLAVHSAFSGLKTDLKFLEKKCNKDMKSILKKSSKKRNPNRAPSGFVKPALISEELATFLGKPIGSEMARTSVTKEINQYIKEKSLGDKTNGRHIIPDEALSKLLKLSPTDELTYFNLQRYMSHHFSKSVDSSLEKTSV
jgi:chromatin remodeling complex protein RSC6